MKFQGIKVAVADLGEESPLPYHHHLIKSRQGKQKKPPPPAPLPLLRSRSGSPLKGIRYPRWEAPIYTWMHGRNMQALSWWAWHERRRKKKIGVLTGIETMVSRTPGGRFIGHWATHGEQDHMWTLHEFSLCHACVSFINSPFTSHYQA